MQDMGDGIHYKSDRQGVSTFGETACGRPSAHTTDDVNEVSCRDCRQILQQMARSTSVAYRLAGLAARGGSPHIHMTERTLSSRRGEVIDDEVGMKSAQERLRTSHRSRNRPNGARKRAAGRP